MSTLVHPTPKVAGTLRSTGMERLDADWFQRFLKSGCVLSGEANSAWIGYGKARWSAHPHAGHVSLYAPDFLLNSSRPWLIFEAGAQISIEELGRNLDAIAGGGPGLTWNEPSLAGFAKAFSEVQDLIEAGTLMKAVPIIARTASRPLTEPERARALSLALKVSAGYPMMAYGFWTEEGDGMIGATPELLFEQCGDALQTMALAGTRPVDSDRGSLLEDPKEVLEHRLVIDGIVDRLTPLGQVSAGMTAELRLPTLIHLYTPIEVVPTVPIAFEEAVAAMHPTPAIGAWPLGPGWEWLRAQPSAKSRGRFGAPFGLVSPDGESGRCVVAIRNVQWTADGTEILAGCGVVGPSKLEREWNELSAKLDAVQSALGL